MLYIYDLKNILWLSELKKIDTKRVFNLLSSPVISDSFASMFREHLCLVADNAVACPESSAGRRRQNQLTWATRVCVARARTRSRCVVRGVHDSSSYTECDRNHEPFALDSATNSKRTLFPAKISCSNISRLLHSYEICRKSRYRVAKIARDRY